MKYFFTPKVQFDTLAVIANHFISPRSGFVWEFSAVLVSQACNSAPFSFPASTSAFCSQEHVTGDGQASHGAWLVFLWHLCPKSSAFRGPWVYPCSLLPPTTSEIILWAMVVTDNLYPWGTWPLVIAHESHLLCVIWQLFNVLVGTDMSLFSSILFWGLQKI